MPVPRSEFAAGHATTVSHLFGRPIRRYGPEQGRTCAVLLDSADSLLAMARGLVIGEALVDVVTGPDGLTRGTHPGGSPANVALGLARLEHDVRLLTWIGEDDNGRSISDHLEASGVMIVPGSTGAARTSVARATLDSQGAATYDFDIEWRVATTDLPTLTGPFGVDVVHTGSIAAILQPGSSAVESLLDRFIGQATITYDPNARPGLMGEADVTLAKVFAFVETADVVKVSDDDLAWLHPGIDPLDVADSWLMRGPSLVVVTRGDGGADALCRGGWVHVDAVPTDVVDTVGAGDAFSAGLIDGLGTAGLLGGLRRDQLRRVVPETLLAVLRQAAMVAAITCSRPGADPPWRRELRAA